MDHTTMSYAQLLEAYQALQEHVIALAGAAAVQPRALAGEPGAQYTARARQPVITQEAYLASGGEMGQRIRAHNWAATPLGPVETWPQSLRSAVSILLPSKAQIVLFWGPELITIYNDAYAPTFGAKHPWALGRPARECWSEVWHVIGPLFEGVLRTGEAFWAKDHPFFLQRQGFLEETYYDVSYDPVRIEDGSVGGIFCIVNEQTGRVLGERRLRALRELGTRTAAAKSATEVCQEAAAALALDPADLPFALLYLLDGPGRRAELAGAVGVALDELAAARDLVLSDIDALAAAREGQAAEAEATVFVSRAPETAAARVLVLPIASGTQIMGALVAGVSRFLHLAGDYRDFFDLVAARVSAALANARAYEEERRRAEALAELDRAKTAFFNNVSHEFRTPLTLMLGPIEDILARSEEQIVPANREMLAVVQRNGLRLQKLVNTLLDFSRIEAGRVQAVYEPTDLATMTAELASTFRSACELARLSLIVDCAPLPEPVYVDREMWEKIVLNLLSNAFKFTFAGEIVVTLRPAGEAGELAVRDTGIGISEAELPHLFERFYRVEGARGRTHEGTGIGLALVQDLVQLHGGSVRVESAPGQGSTFRVSIPMGTAHLPAGRIGGRRTLATTALGASPYVEEALRWLPEAASPTPTPPVQGFELDDLGPPLAAVLPLAAETNVSGRRARILWADDNADMRDYVRRLLSVRYDVEAVEDGQVALAAARARRPDLLLADVMMPQLDGFGVLRALRADLELRTLPVILLSARAGEEARIEGLEAGADAYLIKPFSARELLAHVEAHLELGRLRARAEEALRESERRFRTMIDALPAAIYTTDAEGRLTHFNPAAVEFAGHVPALGTEQWWASWKLYYPDGTPMPRDACPMAIALREGGTGRRAEAIVERPDGTPLWFVPYPTPLRDSAGRIVGGINMLVDITERKQAEALLACQKQAFEMAALGVPLMHVLEFLVRAVERHSKQSAITAIHLLDASGRRFAQTAAPSLPPAYTQATNGMEISAAIGPCCAAVSRRQRVAVADVAASKEFPAFAAFALPLGIRAGWSTPIFSSTGAVLGTVAHYYREVREPHPQDDVSSTIVTRTAAIIIERQQAEEALRARETALRESEAYITRLNAQLRADLTDMTRLQHVSTQLVQTSDVAALLHEILDTAIEITRADMGNIQLRRGDALKTVAQRGFAAPFLAFFDADHEGLAACGTALQRGERVIVEDVATSALFAGSPARDVMLAAQARAVQSTPLVSRSGRVLGMFSTHYRVPQRPAPRELRLLDLLARQAADFIERTQAEDTVRQRTAQFETLINAAPLGVYLVDADFRIRQVNPTALPAFGDIPDLIGQDFDEVIHRLWSQAYADEIVRLFRHTLATGEPYMTSECIEERRDREVTEYYEWQIHRLPLPEGRDGVVCYFRDISAQVLSRQAIAASEARYRQLAATLDQRVQERTALLALIQDVTRAANEAPTSTVALQYAVDRFCASMGWPIGHVYLAVDPGADRWAPTALWHLDAPERFATFQQATQALEAVAGESLIGWVGAHGQPEWRCDVATDPTFERRHAAQEAGLRTGVAWPLLVGSEVAGVLEFYTTEALAPHPALLEAMTQIGTQLGRVVERERAAEQRQRQQEALLQREKLAAMSTLLASVAHELNNPLASIVLQVELLREDLRNGPLAEPVAEITQAAVRCERLVRQFLTLARQHPPERTVVALNTLVMETVDILTYPLRVDNIVVSLHLDEEVPPLWGDPHQLQQVLINLLTNAQQALRAATEAREVTLTTQYDPALQRITVAVADTGPGIPLALQARIFEPFFTTKPPGVGTGLGLPLCRGIVEAHGGTLEVTSAPGHGATFRLTLPLGAVPALTSTPPRINEAPMVRGGTVLVVDDEVSLAQGLARLLRRDGHTVETVENGRLALAQLEARAYDLILCDVRMPELDGPSLYRLLERQQPQLCQRLIFLTGDTLEPATQAFLEASGAPCLVKPFAIAEARRLIQQILRMAARPTPGLMT